MPTYEYICEGCDHEFEQFQSITAAPTKVCPECKKKKVKRKISIGAGVIFKGGGFYETDYRSDAYKKSAEADKAPASSGGDSKPEAKSETKSEAKPDSKSDATPAPAAKSESKPKPKKKD